MTTKEAVGAYLAMILTTVEAVAAAGPAGLPEGHLYAAMMTKVTLQSFKDLVRAAIRGGAITRQGHLLTADPEIQAAYQARQAAAGAAC